jgi:hypothetical protein
MDINKYVLKTVSNERKSLKFVVSDKRPWMHGKHSIDVFFLNVFGGHFIFMNIPPTKSRRDFKPSYHSLRVIGTLALLGILHLHI